MSANPFHLAWFLNGFKVQTWNSAWAGVGGRHLNAPALYIDLARSLERAGFDYILLEDSSFVPDGYGGTSEAYLKNATMVPKGDPAVLASLLTQATSHLGVVPTLSISEYPPYLLARLVATLDQVSNGRSGWNIVTGSSDRAAQNYGRDALPLHAERYARADEFADLVTQLWESWAPDAIVEDFATNTYADHTKVNPINFVGKWFSSRGPLNVPRSPQGLPVKVQAGGSPAGRQFASKWADTIIGYVRTPEQMKEYRDDVRARAVEQGRAPDDVKVLFLVDVTVGATDDDAQRQFDAEHSASMANPESELAMMGFTTNIDFSRLDLDRPVSEQSADLHTNGHRSVLDGFLARAGSRTLREVLVEKATPELIGSPDSVAAQLDEIMQHVGGDGFLFNQDALTRHSFSTITDGLVPALQRRGLVRQEYSSAYLRENLFEF
ncbi:MAG: NtaA/DmoA family FMN-dependent monooxygenase [Mycobacterium sp.]